ncbi:hypothetical protein niasHS_013606 [Heterodera schachtii]|uniref:Uncharacterized protein n=1 Tax=Heterodera schachtii TaxID=97005 RepID=A0ABD2IGE9_HETSC
MNGPPSLKKRISRSLVRIPSNIRRSLSSSNNNNARDTSHSRCSPRQTPTKRENGNGGTKTDRESQSQSELLNQYEIELVRCTLNRALREVDFGNEIVIRLLNDKRSLFKSLLARCAAQAHEIEVFDVQSLAQFCPRAVQVGDGVTRFFEKVSIAFGQCTNYAELEQTLFEMCQANGQMHYRMKVWFQAENWLCVKHSVVDTILMANSNLKRRGPRSAGDLSLMTPRLKKHSFHNETFDRYDRRECIEMVWMKLMQAVITWMKQGFLEAAMCAKEEQDEEL